MQDDRLVADQPADELVVLPVAVGFLPVLAVQLHDHVGRLRPVVSAARCSFGSISGIDSGQVESTGSPVAKEALERIAQLYAVEVTGLDGSRVRFGNGESREATRDRREQTQTLPNRSRDQALAFFTEWARDVAEIYSVRLTNAQIAQWFETGWPAS